MPPKMRILPIINRKKPRTILKKKETRDEMLLRMQKLRGMRKKV